MYHSSGNYEAFARPRKPAGVEKKTGLFVGAGPTSLAGAAFLIRDGWRPPRLNVLSPPGLRHPRASARRRRTAPHRRGPGRRGRRAAACPAAVGR
jgi:hypothetical protein